MMYLDEEFWATDFESLEKAIWLVRAASDADMMRVEVWNRKHLQHLIGYRLRMLEGGGFPETWRGVIEAQRFAYFRTKSWKELELMVALATGKVYDDCKRDSTQVQASVEVGKEEERSFLCI